ncbi:MAG: hypothetical protein H5U03_02285 [Clostridia bacterium]|nr:hypothetical protein [Clostridia bacterium]
MLSSEVEGGNDEHADESCDGGGAGGGGGDSGHGGGSGTTMNLPEGAIARLGLGWISFVTYSPDRKWLVVGTSLGVELRGADTLELAAPLIGHTEVSSVAFSPWEDPRLGVG